MVLGQHVDRDFNEDQWVFSTDALTPLDPAIRMKEFKRIAAVADVPDSSFHALRHASANLAVLAGVDSDVLNERLGHSSDQSSGEQQSELANAVSALLTV